MKTIEKFLPFHAVCSQGHLDILKLLVNFNKPHATLNTVENVSTCASGEQIRVYTGANGQKYASMFDLNARDDNDLTGLYTAVLASKYDICEYLLNLRVKQLTEQDLARMQQEKESKNKAKLKNAESSNSISLFSSLLSSLSSDDINQNISGSSGSSSNSFFDQLKNVFLDPKPTVDTVEAVKSMPDQAEPITPTAEAICDENAAYFNPINVNAYSKFGSTCLHEAIRSKQYALVNLLLNNGADANLPIYDTHIASSQVMQID